MLSFIKQSQKFCGVIMLLVCRCDPSVDTMVSVQLFCSSCPILPNSTLMLTIIVVFSSFISVFGDRSTIEILCQLLDVSDRNSVSCFLSYKSKNFNSVSSKPVYGEVYSIQHYVIKFFSDLRQVGGFLLVLLFPPPIELTARI